MIAMRIRVRINGAATGAVLKIGPETAVTTQSELVHAAVTLNATSTPSVQDDSLVQELKTLCQESLAPYKVPRQIEIVADFPRGPTGKIQKHILRNRARAHK